MWNKFAIRYNDKIVKAFERFETNYAEITEKKYSRIEVIDFLREFPANVMNGKLAIKIKWFEGGTETISILFVDEKFKLRTSYAFRNYFPTGKMEYDLALSSITLTEAAKEALNVIETMPLDESYFSSSYNHSKLTGI